MLYASLVWNINIAGGTATNFDNTATLYDLDLFLHDVTDPLNPRLIASSTGTADNTENLWVPLSPGRSYRLQVKPAPGSSFNWHYALAWRMTVPIDAGSIPPVTVPGMKGLAFFLASTGLALLIVQKRKRDR